MGLYQNRKKITFFVELFASLNRLIADGALNNNGSTGVLNSQIRNTANPKCDTSESRTAAYSLLCQLAKDNAENTKILVDQLLQLHLAYDESLVNEKFEFEPPTERPDPACNFVGSKTQNIWGFGCTLCV